MIPPRWHFSKGPLDPWNVEEGLEEQAVEAGVVLVPQLAQQVASLL